MKRQDPVLAFVVSLLLAACGGGGSDKACVDADGDGYGEGCGSPDCDDADPAVYRSVTAYPDVDGDGHGVGSAVPLCVGASLPPGSAETLGDCAPDDPSAWAVVPGYADADGDGANDTVLTDFCTNGALPSGASSAPGDDCDDADPLVHAGMVELADDGIDNDCSGGDLAAATASGVYVDAGAACAAGAGTIAAPFCAIGPAITYAQTHALHQIFVTAGTYLAGADQSLTVPAGVSIRGGYDASFTAHTGSPTALGELTGTCSSSSCARVTVNVLGDTVLQDVAIRLALTSGFTNKGLVVTGSGTFVLADSEVAHHDPSAGSHAFTLVELGSGVTSWLLRNDIGGYAADGTGTSYGINNAGTARLVGNVLYVASSSSRYTVNSTGALEASANVFNGPTTGSGSGINRGVNCNVAPRCALYGNVIYPGSSGISYTVYTTNTPTYLFDNVIVAEGNIATGVRLDNPGSGSPEWVLAGNDLYAGKSSISRLATVSYVDLNTAAAVNGCSAQGCASSVGNLSASPAFVRPAEDPRLGDWHLTATSPCLGAGVDPGALDLFGLYRLDLDGQPRPLGGFDCGADER